MTRLIYINGRFLTQRTTGVQRVAIEIVKALDEILTENKPLNDRFSFKIICPHKTKIKLSLKNIEVINKGFFNGHIWEQIELPFLSANSLLLNLCNVAPLIKREQYVMIHDTAVYAFPEAYSFLFRSWYKINYFISSRYSKGLLTVSEFSKSELQKYLKIRSGKVDVIYPASVFINDLSSQPQSARIEMPYVLAVSSLNPQKNISGIISAFQYLQDTNIKLMIVGGSNNQVFKSIGLETSLPNVEFLGYVSDDQLVDLYANALCFLYPSFYEGFGLPPLEAMSCGCPVIVSNRASLPEVCNEAALYCDPTNPEQIASLIINLNRDPYLRSSLRKKGQERVHKFSFNQSAFKLFEILECSEYNK